MKITVNYPTTDELKAELENKVALFNATLVVEAIKRLNYDNKSKRKIVNALLKELEKKM